MEIKEIKIVKNFGLLVLKLTLKDQNWSLVCKYVTSKQNSFQESSKQKLWIKKLYKTRKIKSTDRPFTQVIVWELKYPVGILCWKQATNPDIFRDPKKHFPTGLYLITHAPRLSMFHLPLAAKNFQFSFVHEIGRK